MTISCWLDPLPAPRPPLRGAVSCDVLVIGAGLTGASAALHLRRAGLDVVLVEARQLAQSASGRNAGFILQGTAERYDRAVDVMGRERARRIHAWTLENHRRMAEAIAALGLDCGYQRRGSLQLADTEQEEASLVESARLLVEDGFEATLLRADGLPPVFQAAGYRLGVMLPGDGEVDPARLVRGLVAAFEAEGGRAFEGSPVASLDASSVGEVRVEIRGPDGAIAGEVSAVAAAVATNARVGELLPSLASVVDPVRGQMMATGPLPPLFPCPVYANHGYDYWRQDERGCVALGGWRNLDPGIEVGHDEILHPEIQSRMTAFLSRFLGPDFAVSHRWSGIMGFSRDGLPLVGPAPGAPGAVVGAGFTGHGFGFAFLAGAALAEVIVEGGHPFAADLDPRRFL